MKDLRMIRKLMPLLLFAALIVIWQLHSWLLPALWGTVFVSCYLLMKAERPFLITTLAFGAGYGLYLNARSGLADADGFFVLLSERLLLLLIVIPLLFVAWFGKTAPVRYWNRPDWNRRMELPWIWSGFHHTTVKNFLIIAILANILVLSPFYMHNIVYSLPDLLLPAVLFALVNASLEELVWRGALLSRFSEQLGERWAVILTSAGFGLQHYTLGFSWPVCLFFVLGGFYFGGLTVKANSIFPAMAWHGILNVLMVLCGWIAW